MRLGWQGLDLLASIGEPQNEHRHKRQAGYQHAQLRHRGLVSNMALQTNAIGLPVESGVDGFCGRGLAGMVEGAASPSILDRMGGGFPPGSAAIFTVDVAGRCTFEGYIQPRDLGGE